MSPQEALGGPCARRAGETTGVLPTRPCSRPHSPLAAAPLLLCSSGAGALLPPQHGGARAQGEAPARLLEGRHGPTQPPGNECEEGVTQPREAQVSGEPALLQLLLHRPRGPSRPLTPRLSRGARGGQGEPSPSPIRGLTPFGASCSGLCRLSVSPRPSTGSSWGPAAGASRPGPPG